MENGWWMDSVGKVDGTSRLSSLNAYWTATFDKTFPVPQSLFHCEVIMHRSIKKSRVSILMLSIYHPLARI